MDETYVQADQDSDFNERTLDVISVELTTANECMGREAASKLTELLAYFEQTLDLHQGLGLCFRRDAEGEFVHTLCRGGLARKMGFDGARVEHKRLGDFLPRALTKRMERIYELAWSGKLRNFEGGSKRREVSFFAVFHPRFENGEVSEVIVSAIEITELKNPKSSYERRRIKLKY